MEEMNLRNYAYLGDAVWELLVREITVYKTQNANELHKITTQLVNAKFQCEIFNQIQNILNEKEADIARRARNLPIPVARRSNQSEYRTSTSFEALVGWWYKNDKARLDEIFEIIKEKI